MVSVVPATTAFVEVALVLSATVHIAPEATVTVLVPFTIVDVPLFRALTSASAPAELKVDVAVPPK
jgi:hypothetical protein